MTNRLEQELHDILETLHVENEHSNTPPEGITVACLYHKADRRDWLRLAQHLEAVQWQVRQRPCTLTWTTDECNPKEPAHKAHIAKVAQAIANAHIIVLGLSIDMQLLLLQQQHLYDALFAKLEEAAQNTRAWGQPPSIAGIRMKAILWDERDLKGIQFLPHHLRNALAGQHHKDAMCVEIARQIHEWIGDILDERNYQATKE